LNYLDLYILALNNTFDIKLGAHLTICKYGKRLVFLVVKTESENCKAAPNLRYQQNIAGAICLQ